MYFRFFDRTETEIDGEILMGERKNYSPRYMINGSFMSLSEVKSRYTHENVLISNMEINKWSKVWKTDGGRFIKMPEDAQII